MYIIYYCIAIILRTSKFMPNSSVLNSTVDFLCRESWAKPTSLLLAASANASCAEKVLLPTPPFPDKTRILCLMFRMRCSMAIKSGSGPFGAVAQIS